MMKDKIIHRGSNRLKELDFELKQKEKIKKEVRKEFTQMLAHEPNFWKRILIRISMRKEIKKRIESEFPPHGLYSRKIMI